MSIDTAAKATRTEEQMNGGTLGRFRGMGRVVAMMVGATLLFATSAHAGNGDHFGVADGDGVLAGGPAFYAGTCDLGTPVAAVGVPPSAPESCIDLGRWNLEPSTATWSTPPAWRLEAETRAGSHPDAAAMFWFKRLEGWGAVPDGNFRDAVVDLPVGFTGDPTAVPKCSAEDLRLVPATCDPNTQVGMATIVLNSFPYQTIDRRPVYNVEPRAGKTAEFMIAGVAGGLTNIPITAKVRTGSDNGITVLSAYNPSGFPVHGIQFTLWGTPWDPEHDRWRPKRGYVGSPQEPVEGSLSVSTTGMARGGLPVADRQRYEPYWGSKRPLINNPTQCTGEPLSTRLTVNSWQNPDALLSYDASAPAVTDCGDVPFDGSLSAAPSSPQAGAASGYAFDLEVPQSSDPEVLSTGHLKKAVVTLPEGVRVNPSAGDGLEGCSVAEANFESEGDVGCPDGSKIGSLEIETPVLEDPLSGSVYLGHPDSNRFDSLLSLILVARGPGVVVKIPGRVDPDPVTGRLTAVFDNNPQLPFSKLHLVLKGGPRAPLSNPVVCGTHTTETTLTSWSGKTVTDESSFEIEGCGQGVFGPSLEAGTTNPLGGVFSPFALTVSRPDGSEELRSIRSVKLPEGLLGDVSSVPLCGEQDADRGSCPAVSRVGHVQVAAGAGSSPLWVPQAGKAPTSVSLTGGYRGAPYGLSIVVPAQAGPFDLGTVVVRAGLHVDPRTAQVTAGVDESRLYGRDGELDEVIEGAMPRIVQGIVLDQREIRVLVDRDDFLINPTDCSEQQITAQITGYQGGNATAASRFKAGDCARLPFQPKLALAVTGPRQVTTGKHPGVRAQVNQTGIGEAGIEKAVVRLPKSLALDPDNAQALCEFDQGTKPDLENHCPKGSIVGRARAKTPLLRNDLAGDVYFVKNVRKDPTTGNLIRTLPMIVIALRGEIAINLIGESSTTKAGRLVNTFNQVPDAPITQFNLNIAGGPNGILAVTRTRKAKINLCATRQIAETDLNGQNGRRYDTDTRIKTPCTKAQVKKAKRAAKARRVARGHS